MTEGREIGVDLQADERNLYTACGIACVMYWYPQYVLKHIRFNPSQS